jgi:type I restriction enzyme S subunit
VTGSHTSWPVRPLGDLVDVLDSRRVPVSAKERAGRPGKVPYYGAAGQVGWIDAPLFDEPLVLLGEDGVQFFDPYKPKSYLIDGPAWVNNHAHVLRTRTEVDRRFLNYYLNSADYRGRANGTTRLKLTQAAMRGMPVPVPEIGEQLRIVGLLDDHLSRLAAADDSLAGARRRLEALWLSHLTTSRISVEAARRMRIGDLAVTTLGKMLDAKKQSGNPVPYLRNVNVRWREFALADVQTTRMTPTDIERFDVRPGDVMVCEGGEPGRCAVWREGSRQVAFQKALHRVRVRDSDRVVPEYLALMLEETIRRGRADRLFTGTTIKHLTQEKLRTIVLPMPALAVQRDVVEKAVAMQEMITRLRESITAAERRSEALRRSLLGAAFSGDY